MSQLSSDIRRHVINAIVPNNIQVVNDHIGETFKLINVFVARDKQQFELMVSQYPVMDMSDFCKETVL